MAKSKFDLERFLALIADGVDRDEAALQAGIKPASLATTLRRNKLRIRVEERVIVEPIPEDAPKRGRGYPPKRKPLVS